MATTIRRPLTSRPLPTQAPSTASPFKPAARTVSCKRPRSPDTAGDAQAAHSTTKRAKPVSQLHAVATPRDEEKERKRAHREAREAEFKLKYSRAFPGWTFYFDLDHLDKDTSARETLESKVVQLGGVRFARFGLDTC